MKGPFGAFSFGETMYRTIQGTTGSVRVTDDVEGSVGAIGVPTAGAITVKEEQFGSFHVTTLNLAACRVPVTDALAYAGLKVYDFPAGRILILGATASLKWAVTTARTTINDSASLTWGVGTATASNITLATTMVDLIPKTTRALDGAVAAYTAVSTAALAASAHFDGTGTAKDAFLNVGFETNTEIDADGNLAANGNITLVWVNLGDY